jgi:hypothetical protein
MTGGQRRRCEALQSPRRTKRGLGALRGVRVGPSLALFGGVRTEPADDRGGTPRCPGASRRSALAAAGSGRRPLRLGSAAPAPAWSEPPEAANPRRRGPRAATLGGSGRGPSLEDVLCGPHSC